MATNWVTYTFTDLAKVIGSDVIKRANQNTDPDSIGNPQGTKTFDPELEDRGTDLINLVIAQFRGAIQTASKYPISVTPYCVPPEVGKHVLNMAAFELICSVPNLQSVIISERGNASPWQKFYDAANEYLEGIQKGQSIVLPTDPTGQNYTTAIDNNYLNPDGSKNANYNPAIDPIKVGANSQYADLQTDQTIFFSDPFCFPTSSLGQP